MTETTPGAAPVTVEERLARLERGLAALTAVVRMDSQGQDQSDPEPQPEARTTAGADALRWLNEHHPAAPVDGHDIENQETT